MECIAAGYSWVDPAVYQVNAEAAPADAANDISSVAPNGAQFGGDGNASSLTQSQSQSSPNPFSLLGAASEWFSSQFGPNHEKKRLLVDARVAKLMADFWTTFAVYSNPNGLPTNNGVLQGTRPVDAPWWPRLNGELPSARAESEMHRSAIKRMKALLEKASPDDLPWWDDSSGNGGNSIIISGDDDEVDREEELRRERRVRDRPLPPPIYTDDELHKRGAFRGEPDIIPLSSYEADGAEDLMCAGSAAFDGERREAHPVSPQQRTMEKYGADPSGHKRSKVMHILKFEEESGVHMFENDCICQRWNKMEYQF